MTAQDNAVIAGYKIARRFAGVTITYTRGASSVEIVAVPGRSTQSVDNGDIITELQTRDYLLLASELVIGGAEVTPERGDTVTVGGEVLALLSQNGEPLWRYTDQTRTMLRIHTKE